MEVHARGLPHWDNPGQATFVTFRLYGSLPASRVFPLERMTSGEAFVAMDRLLGHARSGPMVLRQPTIGEMVVDAIRDGERRFRRYVLHAFVVMPNHVHMLVSPGVPMEDWLRTLKGLTARAANRLLHLSGPFWQDESYDHLVRNGPQFDRITRYIENNPVKAGLVACLEEFAWSSAFAPGRCPARRAEALPHK